MSTYANAGQSTAGSAWAVLASLLAGVSLPAKEAFDDFRVAPDPFDCKPVCWGVAACCPGEVTPGEQQLCLASPGAWSVGIGTLEVFAGDIRVQVRGSVRRSDKDLGVFAHGSELCGVSSYVAGVEFGPPEVFLSRWQCNTRFNRETAPLRNFTAEDLAGARRGAEVVVELTVLGNRLEVRVWPANQERPELPDLAWTDTTGDPHRNGAAGFSSRDGCFFEARVTELSGPSFLRGRCNGDQQVDIADAVCILNWLFTGGSEPGCVAAANLNGDQRVDIADATYLLGHLFLGRPAPTAPFPQCGPSDAAVDRELGCETPGC